MISEEVANYRIISNELIIAIAYCGNSEHLIVEKGKAYTATYHILKYKPNFLLFLS